MVLDNQKPEQYPYQTEFSYRANRLSRKVWYLYNIVGGLVLGLIMGAIMFLVSDYYFSDPARMLIAIVIGVWPIAFTEKRAERTTRVAQIAMALTFGACILAYAASLLV